MVEESATSKRPRRQAPAIGAGENISAREDIRDTGHTTKQPIRGRNIRAYAPGHGQVGTSKEIAGPPFASVDNAAVEEKHRVLCEDFHGNEQQPPYEPRRETKHLDP